METRLPTIDEIESKLDGLKHFRRIKGYVLAVIDDQDQVLVAANATTIEVYGLSHYICNHKTISDATEISGGVN